MAELSNFVRNPSMSIRRPDMATSAEFKGNVGAIEPIVRRDGQNVPEKPTTEMLAAGSLAGGVSVETAWNIYRAMLRAAS